MSINNFFHPLQGIAGLRDMHQIGYIHRDIKPHNLCFGLSEVVSSRSTIKKSWKFMRQMEAFSRKQKEFHNRTKFNLQKCMDN